MTEQNITALIWMLPVALIVNAVGFYAVVKIALTGKMLIERREPEQEPMRGIHDFRNTR
jgi:predicted small integral membrane protein